MNSYLCLVTYAFLSSFCQEPSALRTLVKRSNLEKVPVHVYNWDSTLAWSEYTIFLKVVGTTFTSGIFGSLKLNYLIFMINSLTLIIPSNWKGTNIYTISIMHGSGYTGCLIWIWDISYLNCGEAKNIRVLSKVPFFIKHAYIYFFHKFFWFGVDDFSPKIVEGGMTNLKIDRLFSQIWLQKTKCTLRAIKNIRSKI